MDHASLTVAAYSQMHVDTQRESHKLYRYSKDVNVVQWGDVGGRHWWKARIWSDGGKIQNILVAAITCGSPDAENLSRKSQGAGETKFVIMVVVCFC
jgi:hypothetical protein